MKRQIWKTVESTSGGVGKPTTDGKLMAISDGGQIVGDGELSRMGLRVEWHQAVTNFKQSQLAADHEQWRRIWAAMTSNHEWICVMGADGSEWEVADLDERDWAGGVG